MDHNSYSRYDPDHSQKLHHSIGNDCPSKYSVSQIRVVGLHGSGRAGSECVAVVKIICNDIIIIIIIIYLYLNNFT